MFANGQKILANRFPLWSYMGFSFYIQATFMSAGICLLTVFKVSILCLLLKK